MQSAPRRTFFLAIVALGIALPDTPPASVRGLDCSRSAALRRAGCGGWDKRFRLPKTWLTFDGVP